MNIIYALIKIVILLAFILLAVTNTQSVVFHYLPGQEINLPLIVLLLVFFTIGAVFGVLAMFGRLLSLRNEVNRLRREVKQNSRAPEPVGAANTSSQTHTEPALPATKG